MSAVALVFALLGTAHPALACPGNPSCEMDHQAAARSPEQVQAQEAAVREAAGTHLVLEVAGMTCGHCAERITAALREIDGVLAAAADDEAGTAEVAYDPAKVGPRALVEAIDALGYTATPPGA